MYTRTYLASDFRLVGARRGRGVLAPRRRCAALERGVALGRGARVVGYLALQRAEARGGDLQLLRGVRPRLRDYGKEMNK